MGIKYLIFLNIVYIVPIKIKQCERLNWKTAYAMKLTNNTKWVSSELFECDMAKLELLGREHLHHLFMTELLLVWPVGQMDSHIKDCVTKLSQVPETAAYQFECDNLTCRTIVILFILCSKLTKGIEKRFLKNLQIREGHFPSFYLEHNSLKNETKITKVFEILK